MVTQVSRRGFHEWLWQRITAVLIGAYAVFILAYLLYYQPVYFAQWHQLFHCWLMKIATLIVLLSVLWHAWIGLWTVFTDYVKPNALRLFLEVLVILVLVAYMATGFEILWG